MEPTATTTDREELRNIGSMEEDEHSTRLLQKVPQE
jgi:hypothetical protein